jgi:hypothetical protein
MVIRVLGLLGFLTLLDGALAFAPLAAGARHGVSCRLRRHVRLSEDETISNSGPATSDEDNGLASSDRNGDQNGGLADSGASSFGSYLLPYAGLILAALALASAAFSFLILSG